MNYVGIALFFGLLVLIAFVFWLTRPKLSMQEKDFVSFVHDKARTQEVQKEEIHLFLRQRMEWLKAMYVLDHSTLVIGNFQLVVRTIEDTYQLR